MVYLGTSCTLYLKLEVHNCWLSQTQMCIWPRLTGVHFSRPRLELLCCAYCLSRVPRDITAGRHPVFCVKIAVSFCDQCSAAAAAGFLLRLQPNASLGVCEQYEIFSDHRREITASIPHTCGHNLNCCEQPSDVRLWLERAEFSSSWFSAAGIFFFLSLWTVLTHISHCLASICKPTTSIVCLTARLLRGKAKEAQCTNPTFC